MPSRQSSILFLIVLSAGCLVHSILGQDTTTQSSANKRGLFDSKADCDRSCTGEHDVSCAPIKGGGPQHACRCASTFYSVEQTCADECEYNQYWSLFTHGSCVEYTSTVLPGACNKQCVIRMRTWATVFVIIVFVAAVIIILATLPNCIINCMACLRVRKQQRAIEDMHVAGEVGGGKSGGGAGAGQHMAAASMNPYAQHYPYNYGYYGQRA